ncbi:solute carrier protein [Chloropicon primus]|uniref:Solute carrier protein n=1 Tax=Chloropicon primus TaxID=1764295 RepID=A0A5B8MLL8_9CHLO|nr:solute carrier protein [Chloropicon primus]UPQ99512.1 solute carrier protein [Chloropicon primus]|eukprot:QDZ20302.1 solute carrier protein [Chloropicon primus]
MPCDMSPAVMAQAAKSYGYVIVWMSISITVILFNKWLLAYAGFPFPISLTLWHMFFCSTVGFLCVRVFKFVPSHNLSMADYASRVVPIGLLYALSLWLSNSSYLYLSVSFIQMTKSLMPGLVYFCGIMLKIEELNMYQVCNMVLIAFGVLVCAFGEVNLHPLGLTLQLSALGFEAARLTLVQILIKSKGIAMNPIQSLYYISPACFVCLFIPWVQLESSKVIPLLMEGKVKFPPALLLLNALCAFALNLAVFMLIGKTSALTMNIAGVIKDWLLIWFSFSVFQAPVTMLNLAGYVFCCAGVAVYNYMKLQKMKKLEKKSLSRKITVDLEKNDKRESA